MSVELTSANPVVKSIVEGTAPRPAQIAAARGILPLPQIDLLEVLVNLVKSNDREIAAAAEATLASQETEGLLDIIESSEPVPAILAYFAEQEDVSAEIHEAIISNLKTPDAAIVNFARKTFDGRLLELIALNQQRMIRVPAIIDAIIASPYKTLEAERRALETRREFFEKERGAQQIADELRASGRDAAAEFIEQAEFAENLTDDSAAGFSLSVEDALLIAKHIEIPDSETDDSWLSLEYIEEFYEESEAQRQVIIKKILGEMNAEDDEITADRISTIRLILKMSMKDRVKLAQKGDREARGILIRDPNRIVAQAVINNPRITEQEVEKIAAMRTVPEDVLRQIAIGRKWARIYPIIHNLARNPRTPMANVIGILTRLQLRDLKAIAKSRNVSEAVRKQSLRLAATRRGS